MDKAYAFRSEADLDTTIEMVQRYRDFNTVNRDGEGGYERTVFAKVVTLRAATDDKQCTAVEVIYNAMTRAFEAPEGTAWTWDSDNVSNDYTTTDLFASEALEVDQVVEVFLYPDKSETEQWMAKTSSGGGGSLVYATSPNTTFDASFTYGATVPFPNDTAGNSTALTSDAVFKLSTPWNTAIDAPDKLFAFWNKIGDTYYLPVDTFYIKPSVDYSASAGAGISTFTCYYNKVATLSLGTNTAFPATVKALLDGFTATGASASVRGYFNGKIFPASYDSENNIVYIDHPIY